MAQVDFFNYFSIIFWFVLFFSIFYILNYIYIIPFLYSNLFIRFKYFLFYYNKIKNNITFYVKLKFQNFIAIHKFNIMYLVLKFSLYGHL